MVLVAASLYAAFAIMLLMAVLMGLDQLWAIMTLLFLAFTCLGLVMPTTMVMAMEEHGPIAGSASALAGAIQMLTGGLMIVVASLLLDGTMRPMASLIAACSLGVLAMAGITLGRSRDPVEQLERASSSRP